MHWATLISSLWHADRRRSHPKTRRLRRRNADTAQGAPQGMYVVHWIEVILCMCIDLPMQRYSLNNSKRICDCLAYVLYSRLRKTNLTTTIPPQDPRLEPKGSSMRFCCACAFGLYPAALLAIMCTGRLSSRPFDMQSCVEVIRRRGG